MRPERLVEMMDDGDILDIIEIAAFQQSGIGENLLDPFRPGFGEADGFGFLIDFIVAFLKVGDQCVDGLVKLR